MTDLTIWTYDRVPHGPRRFLWDLRLRPATEAYVARITARPACQKAHADQMAHFAAAD